MKRKEYCRKAFFRYLEFIVGIILLAITYNYFLIPCNIVYGIGGLGIIFKKIWSLEPSTVMLIGNIILLFFSLCLLGVNNTKRTILGSLLYPIFVKLTAFLPTSFPLGEIEPVLQVLCGTFLAGLGLGLVFKAGFTTGGTDILNQIVSKFGKVSLGKAMLYTDGLIIILSWIFFDFQTFIYSLINLCIVSFITDKVVLGISQSKAFFIVTEHETSVKRFIMNSMIHGVTVLEGRGGYTGDVKKVIMCIVPTSQYYILKEGIKQIDENAFFVVTDAYEVSGGA